MRLKQHRDNTILSYIVEVMVLRLREKEALDYLHDKGFTISRDTYYRLRREVNQSAHERLNLIASKEFLTQHIERIDVLRTILNEMWSNYHNEKNPLKRVQILEKIEENQIYLSSYYDSTRWVLEQAAKAKQQETANWVNSSDRANYKKKKKEVNNN